MILGQTKSAHAEVILPDTSAFLTVVVLFVFHLARHRGEAPGGAFFGVKCAAGFLAQFLAGDEFGHGIASFHGFWQSCIFVRISSTLILFIRANRSNNVSCPDITFSLPPIKSYCVHIHLSPSVII